MDKPKVVGPAPARAQLEAALVQMYGPEVENLTPEQWAKFFAFAEAILQAIITIWGGQTPPACKPAKLTP